jgi:hypothetical protein
VIQFQLNRLVDDREEISVRNDDVHTTHTGDWIHFQFPPPRRTEQEHDMSSISLRKNRIRSRFQRIMKICTRRGVW